MKKIERLLEYIVMIVFLVALLFFVFMFIRISFTEPDTGEYCKEKYGESFIVENFEKFGYYCVELDYENMKVLNKYKIDWEELNSYCGTPSIWDLTKWSPERCKND